MESQVDSGSLITDLILTLQTTTFGAHGGIPTFNRCVCRALNEFEQPLSRVLIATDTPNDIERPAAHLVGLEIEGFGGKRNRFVIEALGAALAEQIDVALLGHVNYAPLGVAMKRVRPRLRFGVMVHGVEVWSRLSALKRYALRQADFIISVSQYTKEKLIELNGVAAERVDVLPNTLEWDDGHAEEIPRALPPGVKLLSVCRLEESERYKGIDTVIRSLPSVLDQVKDLNYFVIGSGSDLERHKDLARSCGVGDRVHFVGAVDQATLRAYYRACDLFVMPSAGEGFGIVFLEAMQYGKAVIAAASGAAPEVVLEGDTGLLVEYGNVRCLSEAISKLCQEKSMRETFGRAGYRRLQENFGFTQFQKRLTAILSRELGC